jgi:1,4-alpha-glucan branching enzyme
MKIQEIVKRDTAIRQTPAPEKNQSQILVEDKPSEKSCVVSQFKDGVMFTAFYPGAASVQIAGDFNNWQPDQTAMKKVDKNGLWRVKLPLSAGTHRYRFVVEGHWHQDPYNEAAEPNSYGEFNSVIHVR